MIDPLTKLPGRRFLEQQLAKEFDAARQANLPLSVIALDLDHFGTVNKQWLLHNGDKVLVEVATLMLSMTRLGDVLFRDGGDQFTLMMPASNGDDARREAERIRSAVASARFTAKYHPEQEIKEIRLTVSLGVACLRGADQEGWELYVRARTAVHIAKNLGRNRVAVA